MDNIHDSILKVLDYLRRKSSDYQFDDDSDLFKGLNSELTLREVNELVRFTAPIFDACIKSQLEAYLPKSSDLIFEQGDQHRLPAFLTKLNIPGDWVEGKFIVRLSSKWKLDIQHLLSVIKKCSMCDKDAVTKDGLFCLRCLKKSLRCLKKKSSEANAIISNRPKEKRGRKLLRPLNNTCDLPNEEEDEFQT